MKISVIFFIFFITVVIFPSCEKNGGLVLMHLNETGCANPWDLASNYQIGINDPDYEIEVRNFLEQQGINVRSLTLTNDGPLSGCFSCFCTTGRRINIYIYEVDQEKSQALGFYPE